MISIKRVRIQNFQSHSDTTLEFTEGLNVITGPSDQGKSSVIRAIKWVLYNEPRGKDFIRQGSTSARVSVELSNGYEIIRERSNTRNRYIVKKPDNTEMTFEGFGNEIPVEVLKAHGIPEIVLDENRKISINISDQHEAPFLLSETAAVRAKAIGRLTGLHIIDRAIKECILDIKHETQNIFKTEKELQELESSLKAYDRLDEMEEKLFLSEEHIKAAEQLKSRADKLQKLAEKLVQCNHEIKRCESIIESANVACACEEQIRQFERVLYRLEHLVSLKNEYVENQKNIYENMQYLEKSSGINEASILIEKIQRLADKIDRLELLSDRYYKIEENIAEVEKRLKDYDSELETIMEKYEGYLISYGKCPLCESSLDKNRMIKILEKFKEKLEI